MFVKLSSINLLHQRMSPAPSVMANMQNMMRCHVHLSKHTDFSSSCVCHYAVCRSSLFLALFSSICHCHIAFRICAWHQPLSVSMLMSIRKTILSPFFRHNSHFSRLNTKRRTLRFAPVRFSFMHVLFWQYTL